MLGEWDLEKLLSYPLNIYPIFEGTKADKRNNKLDKILRDKVSTPGVMKAILEIEKK
jgi:hypothetical protein